MATLEQCLTALEGFVGGLAADPALAGLDRSVSCRLTDLGQVVQGRLVHGTAQGMTAVADGPGVPKADIRITTSSDDLVALTDGTLPFGTAWLSGRVKLEAGLRDMLKLRALL